MKLFPRLADSARVWIFAFDHAAQDPGVVEKPVRAFLESWTSHGIQVEADATLLWNRFLIVAGSRTDGNAISGCGIDALMQAVAQAADSAGLRLLSPLAVHYRDDAGSVVTTTRKGLRSLVLSGAIEDGTPVFDLSVTTLGAVRAGQFERPFGDSWHARIPGVAVQAA